MIDKALQALAEGIDDYLVRLPELNINSQDTVHLTNIVKADGNIDIPADSLGLSLVNIEEERILKDQQAYTAAADGRRVAHVNPELKLNLYILIVANFNTYETGLKFLSGTIRFFQSKNVFSRENTPDLDPSVKKLIVDLFPLNFEQQNHLWGALGAKYLPSVMYKVRLLTVQEIQAADDQAPVRGFKLTGTNM
jgi:hypothetical protein